ncbi:MAG TPA: phosphoglycerate kinase [Methanomicrobiales archaeon]|nr:phosphoglycerate kinase [Methanomicrobiales archaeon]
MAGTIGTLDEVRWAGRTVLLRLDLNSPIDPFSNQILDDKRFREHIPTIERLRDAKLVIISHQSRPGKKDFTTLEAHAGRLGRLLRRPVRYLDDIIGARAKEAAKSLAPGEILMLENVRFSAEENLKMPAEQAAKTLLVKGLAAMGDLFVNDAFGTAHRSQPTVVGLPLAMRSVAGLLMEKEVSMLSRALAATQRPVTAVMGGTKVDDSIAVMAHMLDHGIADAVIVTGVVANVFLLAKGYDIGEPSTQLIHKLEYVKQIELARELLERHGPRIQMPSWVAVRKDNDRAEFPVDAIPKDAPVLDIGVDAIEEMTDRILASGTVIFNGPAGVFEEEPFSLGTIELLNATSRVPFSVIGGGHTGAMVEKLGLEGKVTHVSTGGGACIEFLTGKKLPAVEALELSKKKFG